MKLIRDRKFYKQVVAIAVPLALQNLITLITNLADSVMLGSSDFADVGIAAATQANQPFFLLNMCCFGLAGGAMVLNSQYLGKGDWRAIRRVFSIVIKCGFAVAALFAALLLSFPVQVMQLFASDPAVVEAGADYLRIFGWGYLFFGLSSTMIFTLRSVEIVKISVFVNLSSFFVNVFLNWLLIFGNLGAPALGIRGAAIATLAARILECVITYVYVFFFEHKLNFRPRHLLLWDKLLSKDLFRFGAPVLCNEILFGAGMSLQAVILGHIVCESGDPVTANSISSMVQQLSTLFIFGVANAAAVLVGRAVGEGNHELARQRAHTFRFLGYAIGLVCSASILLLRMPIVNLYPKIDAATKVLAGELVFVTAFIAFFISTSAISIVGSLRGAGDTKFCFFTEMCTMWGVALPLAAAMAFLFHVPVWLVLFCMKVDEPLKAIACIFRLKSTRWIRSVTREFAEV